MTLVVVLIWQTALTIMAHVQFARVVIHSISLLVSRKSSHPELQDAVKSLSFILTLAEYVIRTSSLFGTLRQKSLRCHDLVQRLDHTAVVKSANSDYIKCRICPSRGVCVCIMPMSATQACFLEFDKIWCVEQREDFSLPLQGSLRARIILTLTQLPPSFIIRLVIEKTRHRTSTRLIACLGNLAFLYILLMPGPARGASVVFFVILRDNGHIIPNVYLYESAVIQMVTKYVRTEYPSHLKCRNLLFYIVSVCQRLISRMALCAIYMKPKHGICVKGIAAVTKLSILPSEVGTKQCHLRLDISFSDPSKQPKFRQLSRLPRFWNLRKLDVLVSGEGAVKHEPSVASIISVGAALIGSRSDCQTVVPLRLPDDCELNLPWFVDVAEMNAAKCCSKLAYAQLRKSWPILHCSPAAIALRHRSSETYLSNCSNNDLHSEYELFPGVSLSLIGTGPVLGHPIAVRPEEWFKVRGSNRKAVLMLDVIIQPTMSTQWSHLFQHNFIVMLQWRMAEGALVSS